MIYQVGRLDKRVGPDKEFDEDNNWPFRHELWRAFVIWPGLPLTGHQNVRHADELVLEADLTARVLEYILSDPRPRYCRKSP